MNINDIFDEFRIRKTDLEWTINDMKKDINNYLDKIVLYGAGSAGIAFLHYINDAGLFPVYFSDGDVNKHGKMCEGIEIIDPKDIVKKVGSEALVIVTINTDGQHYCRDFKAELLKGGHKGVHKMLSDVGCKNIIDYVYFRKCFRLFEGGKYNLPAVSDVYLMEQHESDIKEAYSLLEDEMSREIFLGILKYRFLDDSVDIPIVSEENMYFEYDIFPRMKDEVLVDCGACGGSSLSIFLRQNECVFSNYYGIEPDPYNYERLVEYVTQLSENVKKKMKCINKAVYDKDGVTNFFVLNGPGTFAADIGSDEVKTVTIDSLLDGTRASYIKMNIEGSEVPALKGAENTIKTYKPRMGIMGYHKTSDFWEIPLLIKSFCPDYKIYLKSYMKNVAFCYFFS